MDAGVWVEEHAGILNGIDADEAVAVIQLWRAAAAHGTGVEGVELAAPFQRHFTARGTGVPPNFALLLTADEVHAYKFDPARIEHPVRVGHDQFSDLAATWPRAAVRAAEVKPGRAAWGVTFAIDGARAIPCRTPKLTRNVAAGIVDLGAGRRGPNGALVLERPVGDDGPGLDPVRGDQAGRDVGVGGHEPLHPRDVAGEAKERAMGRVAQGARDHDLAAVRPLLDQRRCAARWGARRSSMSSTYAYVSACSETGIAGIIALGELG